ncbi:ankyrin repeat domain-containing protein [Wolbachia endosymbiont of Drosophila barbarae]
MVFFSNSSKDNDDVALFLEGAKFLLSKGADVDVKNNNGITPLHFVVCNGNLEIVKLLVKNGANFNITYGNSTVLNLAKSSKTEKKEEVIKFFKEKVEIEKKRTPLHYAVLNDNNETLNLLLKKRCYDVDAKGSDNRTPLDLAIEKSKLGAVNLLLDHKAFVDFGHLYLAIGKLKASSNAEKIAYLLVEKLKKELNKTKAQFGQGDDDLASQVGKLKEKLKKTEAELAKKKEEMESKIGEVARLDNTIKELKEANAGLERKNSDLINQIDDLNKEKNVLDGQFAEKERVLSSKLGKLEDQLKKQTKELDDTKQNLDSRISAVAKLEKTKVELERNINDLTDRINNEKSTLTSQFVEQKKTLSDTQARLEQEKTKLQDELKKEKEALKCIQAELKAKEEELNNAKQGLVEKTKLEEDLKKAAQDVYTLSDKIVQLTKQNSQLEKQLKELDATQAQSEESKKELSFASEKVLQLEGQLHSVFQKLEKTESKNKELSTQNIALGDQNKKLDKLKDENENKSQQLEALKSYSNQLESQIEILEAQLSNRDREMSGTNQKVAQLEREQDSMKQDLAAKTRELDEVKIQFEENSNELQQSLKGPNSDHINKKLSAVNTQSRKQVIYASVSFVLSGAFAVGASLTTPCLAIFITLAVAALTFFAVGCYCSYGTITALSNVEVKMVVDHAVKV